MLKICDSIAVRIFNETELLATVGNELRHYKSKSKNEIVPWKLCGKIHGIELNKTSSKILIYGEKEFMLLSYKNGEFTEITKDVLSDWISSAKFLEDGNFCLLTAHLVLLELEYEDLSNSCKILQQISCEDKSTLYCSFIIGDIWNNLLVFGGTALEVVIWQPISKTVLSRLSGNNGVILSINVNLKFNLLTTTSDDRSIKFYNIKLDRDSNIPNKLVCTFPDSFIQGYAHTARVFQGKIIEENGQPYAISVGEDSNLCLWNCQGELIFKREHHFGATIWNFDYDPATATVYTIGSDGNCISYNLKSKFTQEIPRTSKILTLNENEKLVKIKFLHKNHIIGTTSKDNLLFRRIESDGWIYINDFTPFKCTVLQVFKEFVCLAGYKKLILFKFDYKMEEFKKIFDKELSSGVIRSVCFLSHNEFLVCDENGNCKYLLNNFETILELKTPQCKEPWITSAFKIDKFIMFSNRQGNLYLYLFENDIFLLKSMIKRVNGKFGITNIILEEDSKKFAIVKTCGHDSTIKIIKLNKELHEIQVISRQNVPISWVEKIEKCEKNCEYVMGFNSIDFVLWSKRDDIIAEINCGGGHRFWDCKLNEPENNVQLIYIKKGQLYIIKSELRNIQINQLVIPRNSWHIKQCNSIKLVECDGNIKIFSGGEDNILKISKLKNDSLIIEQEMSSHISSIKTISFVKNFGDFIIFSAGGRAQICISTFDPMTCKIEENCNYMLKLSDFKRKFVRNTQEIDFDVETRIMCIAINEKDEEIFEIFTGCSDGYIRKFTYTLQSNMIKFSDELFYNKCILHIAIITNSILITAATDGYINFWKLNEFSANSDTWYQIKHHDNGINSLDVKIKMDKILVVTGGDDQTVSISYIDMNLNGLNRLHTNIFTDFHSAQVNGVKISEDCNFIYSASIDQTICKIGINYYCKLITQIPTCIPDIKGIELLPSCVENENIVIVYGCGIESFQI